MFLVGTRKCFVVVKFIYEKLDRGIKLTISDTLIGVPGSLICFGSHLVLPIWWVSPNCATPSWMPSLFFSPILFSIWLLIHSLTLSPSDSIRLTRSVCVYISASAQFGQRSRNLWTGIASDQRRRQTGRAYSWPHLSLSLSLFLFFVLRLFIYWIGSSLKGFILGVGIFP